MDVEVPEEDLLGRRHTHSNARRALLPRPRRHDLRVDGPRLGRTGVRAVRQLAAAGDMQNGGERDQQDRSQRQDSNLHASPQRALRSASIEPQEVAGGQRDGPKVHHRKEDAAEAVEPIACFRLPRTADRRTRVGSR